MNTDTNSISSKGDKVMKKQIIVTALLAAVSALVPYQTFAATPAAQQAYESSDKNYMPESVPVNYGIVLNGNPIDLGVDILNVGGSTMLPLRALATALNVSADNIGWDGDYKTASVTRNERQVEVVRGSRAMIINKALSNLQATQPTFITHSGTSYLPLRSIAEGLDVGVKWEANTKTIYIDTTKTYAQSDQIQVPTQPTEPGRPSAEVLADSKKRIEWSLKNIYNPDMTDAQVQDVLNHIHIAPDGDGSGVATKEQLQHYDDVKRDMIHHPELANVPKEKGDFIGQVRNIYVWTGQVWERNDKLYAGCTMLTFR